MERAGKVQFGAEQPHEGRIGAELASEKRIMASWAERAEQGWTDGARGDKSHHGRPAGDPATDLPVGHRLVNLRAGSGRRRRWVVREFSAPT